MCIRDSSSAQRRPSFGILQFEACKRQRECRGGYSAPLPFFLGPVFWRHCIWPPCYAQILWNKSCCRRIAAGACFASRRRRQRRDSAIFRLGLQVGAARTHQESLPKRWSGYGLGHERFKTAAVTHLSTLECVGAGAKTLPTTIHADAPHLNLAGPHPVKEKQACKGRGLAFVSRDQRF